MAKAKKKAQTIKAPAKKVEAKKAPAKKSKELKVINGRVKVTTTAKAPYHKEGQEINPAEVTALKMIKLGWAKI